MFTISVPVPAFYSKNRMVITPILGGGGIHPNIRRADGRDPAQHRDYYRTQLGHQRKSSFIQMIKTLEVGSQLPWQAAEVNSMAHLTINDSNGFKDLKNKLD